MASGFYVVLSRLGGISLQLVVAFARRNGTSVEWAAVTY
jgi:hypothetical protein